MNDTNNPLIPKNISLVRVHLKPLRYSGPILLIAGIPNSVRQAVGIGQLPVKGNSQLGFLKPTPVYKSSYGYCEASVCEFPPPPLTGS